MGAHVVLPQVLRDSLLPSGRILGWSSDWYTGYPGGRKVVSFERMLARRPERIIELAVKRMLPKTQMGRNALKKLKVFAGPKHEHQAQKPEKVELF